MFTAGISDPIIDPITIPLLPRCSINVFKNIITMAVGYRATRIGAEIATILSTPLTDVMAANTDDMSMITL